MYNGVMGHILFIFILIVMSAFDVSAERRKEVLERFQLNDLKVVGMIYFDNRKMALIEADGILHRVERGNYLGEKNGVIIAVEKDKIILQESILVDDKLVNEQKTLAFEAENKSIVDYTNENFSKYKGEKISFSINNTSVNSVLISLMSLANKNMIIGSSVKQTTGFNIENAPWDFVYEMVLKQNNLRSIEICEVSIITNKNEFESIKKALSKIPKNCLPGEHYSFNFFKLDLPSMFLFIADILEKPIQIDPQINGLFSIRSVNQSWHLIATLVAYLHDLKLEINEKNISVKYN